MPPARYWSCSRATSPCLSCWCSSLTPSAHGQCPGYFVVNKKPNTGFIQCPQGPAYLGVCPLIEVIVRFSESLSASPLPALDASACPLPALDASADDVCPLRTRPQSACCANAKLISDNALRALHVTKAKAMLLFACY